MPPQPYREQIAPLSNRDLCGFVGRSPSTLCDPDIPNQPQIRTSPVDSVLVYADMVLGCYALICMAAKSTFETAKAVAYRDGLYHILHSLVPETRRKAVMKRSTHCSANSKQKDACISDDITIGPATKSFNLPRHFTQSEHRLLVETWSPLYPSYSTTDGGHRPVIDEALPLKSDLNLCSSVVYSSISQNLVVASSTPREMMITGDPLQHHGTLFVTGALMVPTQSVNTRQTLVRGRFVTPTPRSP